LFLLGFFRILDMSWTNLGTRLDNQIDAAVRRECGVSNNQVLIVRIAGDSAPVVTGKRGGHFTKGGARIDHPAAYSRHGWSNMVYRSDTRVITVGTGFRVQ
jgi:hypothetical protein